MNAIGRILMGLFYTSS